MNIFRELRNYCIHKARAGFCEKRKKNKMILLKLKKTR